MLLYYQQLAVLKNRKIGSKGQDPPAEEPRPSEDPGPLDDLALGINSAYDNSSIYEAVSIPEEFIK